MRNVHPRCALVEAAQLDFWKFTIEFKKKHGDLTPIEWLGILDNEIGMTLKFALRAERHPDDPDKPSGIE
jgi:hypothetical protein